MPDLCPLRQQLWLSDTNCEPLPALTGWKQNGSVKLDAGAALSNPAVAGSIPAGPTRLSTGVARSCHSPCGDQNVEWFLSRLRGRAVRRASGDSKPSPGAFVCCGGFGLLPMPFRRASLAGQPRAGGLSLREYFCRLFDHGFGGLFFGLIVSHSFSVSSRPSAENSPAP